MEKIKSYCKGLIGQIPPNIWFYMICENNKPNLKYVKIMDQQIENIILEQVTLAGESGDRSEEFGGLYRCTSIDISRYIVAKNNFIELELEYIVPNQTKEQAKQYTFVIIPLNYGKSIKNIRAIVEGVEECPKWQSFSADADMDYEEKDMNKLQTPTGKQYSFHFAPKKENVYVIQIKLPS